MRVLLLLFSFAVFAEDVIYPNDNLFHVYMAGPLFTEAERREQEDLSAALERSGFTTYLPHRDGFLLSAIQPLIVKMGYPAPVASLWTSLAVDALSIAWTLGKPTVIFQSDVRRLTRDVNNPLVAGRSDFPKEKQTSASPN